MKTHEILERIQTMSRTPVEGVVSPPVELVAMVVRWGRHLRQWKVSTLADYARVSLSTVERVERADAVSPKAMDSIAQALGYPSGAFTTPRLPLEPGQTGEALLDHLGHLEPVAVVPMRTQKSVRDAARCSAFIIHKPDVPEMFDGEIAELAQWLDFAGFALSDLVEVPSTARRGRRELYGDILNHVAGLEKRGLTVLSGVMPAPQPGLPDWSVAILSITPRLTDPGAAKRRHIMVDRRAVALPVLFPASDEAAGA